MAVSIRIPAQHLRKLPDPSDQGSVSTVYFPVRVIDLPVEQLEAWKDVNPREIKKTSIYGNILATLVDAPARFYLRNRGLTISAKDLHFDEKKKEVQIILEEKNLHGVLDGGHTLSACGEAQMADDPSPRAFVNIKVMLGLVNAEEVAEVAGSLNTSQQVDLRSLENLKKHFDGIQAAIEGEPYSEEVAYKMNEQKAIDVREILYYLAVFDAKKYSQNSHPVSIFGRKETLVREFAAEQSGNASSYSFETLITRTKDILNLRDAVEEELLKHDIGRNKIGKKNERIRSPKNKKKTLMFSKKEVKGSVPLGWIMPILGAFRANVEWDKPKGSFSWKVPLKTLLPRCGEELAAAIKEIHQTEGARPEYVGRSATAWRTCYNIVRTAILELQAQAA